MPTNDPTATTSLPDRHNLPTTLFPKVKRKQQVVGELFGVVFVLPPKCRAHQLANSFKSALGIEHSDFAKELGRRELANDNERAGGVNVKWLFCLAHSALEGGRG
ncbi:hypothetical protein CDAR_201481 [Caerostris darwini]|uniref:Uncharacterized protein n=1 Tax=Caerostris darwini TaxID=1538125 RepID=A0AAV4WH76_9ARAC|nr:hypothetical protein CDAR_201481 [Caerostris darwini]